MVTVGFEAVALAKFASRPRRWDSLNGRKLIDENLFRAYGKLKLCIVLSIAQGTSIHDCVFRASTICKNALDEETCSPVSLMHNAVIGFNTDMRNVLNLEHLYTLNLGLGVNEPSEAIFASYKPFSSPLFITCITD